jgi:hypothetical protein
LGHADLLHWRAAIEIVGMVAAPQVGIRMKSLVLTLAAAASLSAATTHCIIVSGLGGEAEYEQRFGGWAQSLDATLRTGPEMKVETFFGPKTSREAVRAAIDQVARQASPEDAFAIFLLGHGTFDGTEYKFNVPGPDISASDLGSWLDKLRAGRQLVVNMTSASGGSVHALQRQNRTVITATKAGTEKNATVFARYWIDALRDAAADTDKNEVISALEAYKFAETKTKQFYETNKRLATEHAMLDGGDASGAMNAGRFTLLRIGNVQKAANDPAKRALLDKREQLEGDIDRLKFQKAAMPTDEYKRKLQALLLELARTQAEIDQ